MGDWLRRLFGSQLNVTPPWNSFEPDLVVALMTPPVVRPNSAGIPPFLMSTVWYISNGTVTAPRPLRNCVMFRPFR